MAIDLRDFTANANNLTNNGATEYNASLPYVTSTTAVSITAASTQNLTATDTSANSLTNNFTLACWVNFATLPVGSSCNFLGKTSAYNLIYHPTFGLRLFTFPFDVTQVAFTASTNTWYHIAVTFASNQVKFYVNGSQQGITQTSGNTSTADTANAFTIGAQSGDEGVYRVDDVRLYNVVKTTFTDRSQNLLGNESNLVAYYPFEDINPVTAGGAAPIMVW